MAKKIDKQQLAAGAWTMISDQMLARRHHNGEIAAELGLSNGDVNALLTLDRDEPRRQKVLVELWQFDPSMVTWQIDRLVERNLVVREISEVDRRGKVIVLTDHGIELQDRLRQLLSEPPPALGRLGTEDLVDLVRILNRWSAAPRSSTAQRRPSAPAPAGPRRSTESVRWVSPPSTRPGARRHVRRAPVDGSASHPFRRRSGWGSAPSGHRRRRRSVRDPGPHRAGTPRRWC